MAIIQFQDEALLLLSLSSRALNSKYSQITISFVSQLASSASRPARWLLSRTHLSDQGGVAHGGRQADPQPLEVAVDDVRLGDEAEGAKVAQADSSQDDVAELAAGRLDHRGVPKSMSEINLYRVHRISESCLIFH